MENEISDLQKYEGQGVVLPLRLWECMAKAYFADTKEDYVEGGSGGEVIKLPDSIFWKVARAYYGDGFSYRQETGQVVADTGGVDAEPTTKVKKYKPVTGPKIIPRGNLARIAAAHHGLQSDTTEGTESSGGDDSVSHES